MTITNLEHTATNINIIINIINMLKSEKEFFAIQPYLVGSKKAKSIAITIPSEVVKTHSINRSTIFILKNNEEKNGFNLEIIGRRKVEEEMINADESFQPSGQQISEEIH